MIPKGAGPETDRNKQGVHPSALLKSSNARPAANTVPRIRSASCWTACAVKVALQSYAGVRVSRKGYIVSLNNSINASLLNKFDETRCQSTA